MAPTADEDHTSMTQNDAFHKLHYSPFDENQQKAGGVNPISEEQAKILMEQLVERVEKLEASETSKVEQFTNITQRVDELRNKDRNVLERYNDKLHNIEKNVETQNTETINEINAIKMEFHTLRNLYLKLKTCCDTNARWLSGENIEKQVERVVGEYFGSGVSKEKLSRIIESSIVAGESKETNNIVSGATPSDGDSENICTKGTALSDNDMRRIVNEVLKIYDADKTGRVDYALESAGGQVISTRCTQRYNVNTRAFKLLGFTLFYESNNPRTVIQGNSLQPGACWAFQDFPGYLLIKLRSFIKVTGFTVEHVPRLLLPNREMRSAPRKFDVWGLKDESDSEPVKFGDYEFQDSEESLQYFSVQNNDITIPYEYVELRIHSNHGQLEYTCLYRFRVHGTPV